MRDGDGVGQRDERKDSGKQARGEGSSDGI